jgi:hypothetical protein
MSKKGKNEKPNCTHCAKKTVKQQHILGIPLCRVCENAHPELYRYVTDKTALAMGLSERFLEALPSHYIVPNRHFGTTVPLKLYLLSDVELSLEAEDAIEEMADFARGR